jgi:predicted component of type VI protein secretion system
MDHLQTAPCSPLDVMTQAPVNTNDAGCKKPLLVESMKLSVDSESAGDEEEEEIEDDDFSPCRDLFSAHFDKLASDLKVCVCGHCDMQLQRAMIQLPDSAKTFLKQSLKTSTFGLFCFQRL